MTLHDLTPLAFGGERRRGWLSQTAYREVLKSAFGRTEAVIVPSRMVANQLQQWVEPSKINVIPHAVPEWLRGDKTTPQEKELVLPKFKINAPYLLYVGNMRNHKNVPTLIQAFAAFYAEEPNAQLVICGPVSPLQRSAIQDVLLGWHLGEAVIITGETTDQELKVLYDHAKLFVLPSFMEGFGIVALEAAARGVPVIASETTPVREFLGKAVLSFNPHDGQQLADLIAHVWYNDDLRKQRAELGQQTALQRNWQMVAKEHEQVYQGALKSLKKIS